MILATALVATAAAPARAETPFRTAWGDPDLQGIWSNATLTPLERLDTVDREFLTETEAETLDSRALEQTLDPDQFDLGSSGESNEVWLELGQGVRSRRTSLVVDPPNGRVPYTAEGFKRRNLMLAKVRSLVPIRSWEDRLLSERCLLTGGLFVPNPFYLNNHQILQTPRHVAIRSELMNETRMIPLDGRPPPDPRIKLWAGASRGHFEGETLVVETTNYNDQGETILSTDELRLVERFTRVDAGTIDYEVTVSDPDLYRRPWTLANTLRATEGPIYEYACHEGNYSLVHILAGARAEEEARAREARARKKRSESAILAAVMLGLALLVYQRRRRTTGSEGSGASTSTGGSMRS